MRSEKRFWGQLKRRLDRIDKQKLHYERLESIYGTGLPDVLVCYCGGYALLELKVYPNKLSPNQKVWHRNHAKAGGNVWTVTQKGLVLSLDRAGVSPRTLVCSLSDIETTIKEITNGN